MNNEEILQKALDRAWQNGWKVDRFWHTWGSPSFPDYEWRNAVFEGQYFKWIFSHEFAKVFWGDKEYILAIYPLGEYDEPSANWHSPEEWKEVKADDDRIDEDLIDDTMPAWKYHLQQMVLEENPVKYLEKFLDK